MCINRIENSISWHISNSYKMKGEYYFMEILVFMCWKLIGAAANLEYLLLWGSCNKEACAWDTHSKMMCTLIHTFLWIGNLFITLGIVTLWIWPDTIQRLKRIQIMIGCILVETCIAVTVHFDWMQRYVICTFTLHPHLINDIKIIPGPTFALDPRVTCLWNAASK